MKKIVILASGEGTNARAIMEHFDKHKSLSVAAVICNRIEAGVYRHAAAFGVPSFHITKEEIGQGNLENTLRGIQPDLIVLAGFMVKIPENIIAAFSGKIVNIHPSLLPKFGGKGMYGKRVHEAVIEAGEQESGITVHLVNEQYDDGKILFQESIALTRDETVDSLMEKVRKLEHDHYPLVIQRLLEQENSGE